MSVGTGAKKDSIGESVAADVFRSADLGCIVDAEACCWRSRDPAGHSRPPQLG